FPLCPCLVAVAATACTSVPPVGLDPEQSAARWRALTLADPALADYATSLSGRSGWPPDRWDARDLTLAALWFNRDLDAAAARARAARAAIKTAGRLPNPTLSFAPQYVSNTEFGSPWVLSTSLLGILQLARKREHRIAEANALAEAARLKAVGVAR